MFHVVMHNSHFPKRNKFIKNNEQKMLCSIKMLYFERRVNIFDSLKTVIVKNKMAKPLFLMDYAGIFDENAAKKMLCLIQESKHNKELKIEKLFNEN